MKGVSQKDLLSECLLSEWDNLFITRELLLPRPRKARHLPDLLSECDIPFLPFLTKELSLPRRPGPHMSQKDSLFEWDLPSRAWTMSEGSIHP